jgi:hypothetical protein
MPAGMRTFFPVAVDADSVATGFAKMTYDAGLDAFVTQSLTAFDAPKTIGPKAADIAFEATDLKPASETGTDLASLAAAQAKAMQFTGTPEGPPYFGEFIETYRGAKEAVTGVPRPMKPWEPPA